MVKQNKESRISYRKQPRISIRKKIFTEWKFVIQTTIGLFTAFLVFSGQIGIFSGDLIKSECSTNDYKISIEHHKNWEIIFREKIDNIDATGTICSLALKDREIPQLIIEKKNVGLKTSHRELIERSEKILQKQHKNAEITHTDPDFRLGSRSAYKILYIVYRGKEEQPLKRLEVGTLEKGQLFTFTYSAKEKEYDKYYEQVVETMFKSINIVKIDKV